MQIDEYKRIVKELSYIDPLINSLILRKEHYKKQIKEYKENGK